MSQDKKRKAINPVIGNVSHNFEILIGLEFLFYGLVRVGFGVGVRARVRVRVVRMVRNLFSRANQKGDQLQTLQDLTVIVIINKSLQVA